MVISNLIGGIGNQMFQFACGRSLSLRLEQEFCISTSQFGNYSLHNGYELKNIFNIDVRKVSDNELRRLLGWRSTPNFRRILGRSSMNWATNKYWINEPKYSYWEEINNVSLPVYLHGYWQSEKYFQDFSDIIRTDFSFHMPYSDLDLSVLDKINKQPSASVHIRRGDYTSKKNMKIYAPIGLDYYQSSIKLMREQVPNIKFFFFSDDPDWVKKEFGAEFGNIDIVRHNLNMHSANDMRLMSNCDHHIISNSSFSWWGAWLNPSIDKVVVAPKTWFINNTNDSDLIPASWIRV